MRSITHSKSQRGGRGKFCEHDAQIHGVYARLDDAHEHRTKRGVVGAKSCVRAPPGRLAASVAVEREGRRRSTQDGGPSSELEREAYLRKRDAERRREGGEPARHLRQWPGNAAQRSGETLVLMQNCEQNQKRPKVGPEFLVKDFPRKFICFAPQCRGNFDVVTLQ